MHSSGRQSGSRNTLLSSAVFGNGKMLARLPNFTFHLPSEMRERHKKKYGQNIPLVALTKSDRYTIILNSRPGHWNIMLNVLQASVTEFRYWNIKARREQVLFRSGGGGSLSQNLSYQVRVISRKSVCQEMHNMVNKQHVK